MILKFVNEKLLKYKEFLKGKTASVIGVGISNVPLIDFLLSSGANVVARDAKDISKIASDSNVDIDALRDRGVKFICGENYLENLNEYIIYKSPGIRCDVPEIEKAYQNGSIITSEMEAFISLCPSKIIAITGSAGKTTTTTLIAKILEKSGKKVFLGGNIGKPLLCELDKITDNDFTVLELSSFQLHTINKFQNKDLPYSEISFPDVAVVTNVTPNHLNWHTDMKEYADAKSNIFKFMKKGATLVTNYADVICKDFAKEAKDKGILVKTFSAKETGADIISENGKVLVSGNDIIDTKDILLCGDHNLENYMAAIGAVSDFVENKDIFEVANTFGGVAHRFELVREKDGVKYYNSSIDSAPERTLAALSCLSQEFDGKIVLILGGKDKNLDFTPLGDVVCKRAKAVLVSRDTPEKKIERAITQSPFYHKEKLDFVLCNGFDDAVKQASQKAKSGDVVLLSPAMTSFDEFLNFEKRGARFKEIVNSL